MQSQELPNAASKHVYPEFLTPAIASVRVDSLIERLCPCIPSQEIPQNLSPSRFHDRKHIIFVGMVSQLIIYQMTNFASSNVYSARICGGLDGFFLDQRWRVLRSYPSALLEP
jgi:hypothetical protein